MRLFPLLVVPVTAVYVLLTVGCSKLEVRSNRETGVPEALLGEWQGQWESSGPHGGGTILVRVQEFDEKPVISVELDNPCIVPQAYELIVGSEGIELRAGDDTVLRATLLTGGVLSGEYNCPIDGGVWTADWQAELPTIVDLSGEWIGEAMAAGGQRDDLLMQLDQSIDSGTVSLRGLVQFPGYMPVPVPVIGIALFRETEFDISLHTTSGIFPALQMIGVGDVDTMSINDGVLVSSGGVVLPFASAAWTAMQTPE